MNRPLALLAALGCLWVSPARAQTDTVKGLPDVIGTAAEEVLKLVKNQPLSIGQVTPTGLPDVNGGPAIGILLRQALERLKPGIVRDKDAPFEVNGTFVFGPHPDPKEATLGQKALRLIFRIVDTQTGEETPLRLSRFFLQDNTSIARVLQPSGPLPTGPAGDQPAQRRERNQAIQDLLKHPRAFVDPARPSVVSTGPDSPYRVEILAGPLGDGNTRPTEGRPARVDDNGLALIDLKQDEVYEIRLYNASPDEVAARVFIDGIDSFQFSDDRDPRDPTKPRFSHYNLAGRPERGAETVAQLPGWHKRAVGTDNFLAFLVTAYGKGASTKGVVAQGATGVIQVQFARSHPLPADGRPRGAGNETGFGPPRQGEQKVVAREIEPFIDAVAIRYAH